MFLCNEKIYILKVSQINVLISKVSDMPLTEDGISFFKWVYPYVGRTVLISTSPLFFFFVALTFLLITFTIFWKWRKSRIKKSVPTYCIVSANNKLSILDLMTWFRYLNQTILPSTGPNEL